MIKSKTIMKVSVPFDSVTIRFRLGVATMIYKLNGVTQVTESMPIDFDESELYIDDLNGTYNATGGRS